MSKESGYNAHSARIKENYKDKNTAKEIEKRITNKCDLHKIAGNSPQYNSTSSKTLNVDKKSGSLYNKEAVPFAVKQTSLEKGMDIDKIYEKLCEAIKRDDDVFKQANVIVSWARNQQDDPPHKVDLNEINDDLPEISIRIHIMDENDFDKYRLDFNNWKETNIVKEIKDGIYLRKYKNKKSDEQDVEIIAEK